MASKKKRPAPGPPEPEEQPEAEQPEPEQPEAEQPEPEQPQAELPQAELPDAELPEADAELEETDAEEQAEPEKPAEPAPSSGRAGRSPRKPRVGAKSGAKAAGSPPADTDPKPDGDDLQPADAVESSLEGEPLSPQDQTLLDQAAADLVAEMRSDMLRAQAELINFRTRVERDRVANRETVIAEVIRSLLPALDDLDRAEAHGDLDGTPLAIVAQKLRAGFERHGLQAVGEKGETFDPAIHEAVVQLPSPDVTVNTVAEVIEAGYTLGDRLVRPAKVAVSVPAE